MVAFLGHVVSASGIMVDLARIKYVVTWEILMNIKEYVVFSAQPIATNALRKDFI